MRLTIGGGGGLATLAANYGPQDSASGDSESPGDARTSLYVLRRTVTTSDLSELFLDGASRRMVVPRNSTWTFDILISARASDGDSAGIAIKGVIQNLNGVTVMVAPPAEQRLGSTPALNVTAQALADDTSDALAIQVTGEASRSLRFVAVVRTAEVGF